jgi:hypothetical protein
VILKKARSQGGGGKTEGFAVSLIFQPGEGRCPSEVLLGVQGGLHYAEFAHAVSAEAMGVVPICGLLETMHTALDKAGLLGNASYALRTVVAKALENPQLLSQNPMSIFCSRGLLNSRLLSAP